MDKMKWLNRYPREVAPNLDALSDVLPHFLVENATRNPEQIATVFMGKKKKYRTLLQEAYKVRLYLENLGVEKGDRVSIALPNCPQYIASYYGVLMLGAIVVQTNPLYTESELEYQFNDAEVKAVICLDLLYPRMLKVKNKTSLSHIITTSVKDALPFPKNILYPFTEKLPKIQTGQFIHTWQQAMASPVLKADISGLRLDDIAVLQYTGGTTGKPKGVMLTHANLLANSLQIKQWFYRANTEKERILSVVPFFHVYGMTTSMNYPLLIGATMILYPRFDVKGILSTIQKERPTIFPGAPTMYIALIHHPKVESYDISSIEACISGSAALPLDVQNRFEELTKGKLVEGYGLSEASPVTHCNPIWEERVNGSIGLPITGTEMKIVDLETGEEVGENENGELLIKGPQVMKGYWRNQEETDLVLKDGWLSTGDIAYYDEKGFTYIVDRKKDMIIASGFNIYPREVEEVLYQHSDVKEAAVIGVPDEYRGETVKAYIVRKEGSTITEKALNKHCRQFLASYKVPRIYEFKEELPKTLVGKVLKRTLKEED